MRRIRRDHEAAALTAAESEEALGAVMTEAHWCISITFSSSPVSSSVLPGKIYHMAPD